MIKRYLLTEKAQKDLRSIAQYSARMWGNDQKNRYISNIKKRIEWLALTPRIGKNKLDIQDDIYSFPEGDHLIFYTIEDDHIIIIGILHNRMDVASHLH
jgi:toxin ParE1/3/4